MLSQWNRKLSANELKAYHANTAKLDPSFARKQEAWYAGRTQAQLWVDAQQAWNCNEATSYQLARSYLALCFPEA